MRKNYLLKMIIISTFLLTLSGCGKKDDKVQKIETSTESSVRTMDSVDSNDITWSTEENIDGSKTIEDKKSEKKEINDSEKNMTLLKAYGKAYASYSSLNSRNDNLRDLMTKECADKNGINYKTGNGLSSEGKVMSIYQNDKEEYAVLLDCIQNGSPIRVLLLAKIKDGLIAEMTYNSIKQEY